MNGIHTPLVSVIVPAYNAEKHIAGVIRSVQAQTMADWELIVVDDCSTDGTAAAVEAISGQDSRIRLLCNEKNSGVAKSRNRGLRECRGEYAAFLDSDDTWRPDKLQLQLECAKATGADIVYTSYAIVDEDGGRQCRDFLVPAATTFEELLKENVIGCSTVLLSARAAQKAHFEEEFFHEDYILWLTLLQQGFRAAGVAQVLVDYFFHTDSKAGNKWKAAQKRWRIYRRYLKFPLFKSARYFLCYMTAGLKKYRRIRPQKACAAPLPATKATLQQHQAVLYELLQAFDAVCRKHDIKYMLFAGTALGAVRHAGFIPWDDDLDVVMLRPEYERFMALAPAELNAEKYYLQSEGSPHWPLFFSKLRRNGTTCLERYVPRDAQMHQGVYIDIFPCDNLADGALMRRLQYAASKAVIAKALDKRGYLTDSLLRKSFMLLCRALPEKPLKRFVQHRGNASTAYVHTFFGGAASYGRNIFPREWFDKTVQLPFADGEYPVSARYDALLTRQYGDYMALPPPEARGCKVHAEFVDLERPYTDYPDYQKNMCIAEYTRSIR